MSAVNLNNVVGQITMADGTEYNIKVSYHNDQNQPVPCDLTQATITPVVLEQLQRLIKTMAVAHAKKAGKAFKELKTIHLNDVGATFPSQLAPGLPLQSHDIDLEDGDKTALLPEEKPAYTKAQQVWTKTSSILLTSYQKAHEDCIQASVTTQPTRANVTLDTTQSASAASLMPPPALPVESQRASPPPPYRTQPPSPTPSGASEQPRGWADTFRHPIAAAQRVFSGAPAPASVDLGRLLDGFDKDALKTLCQPVITDHLTLPQISQPQRSFFSRATPVAPPTLTSLTRVTDALAETARAAKIAELDRKLTELAEITKGQVESMGIGAIVDAIDLQCKTLVEALPATGADGYKEHLCKHFTTYLKDQILEEHRKDTQNKTRAHALWELFNDRGRNTMKDENIALTRTSFGISL